MNALGCKLYMICSFLVIFFSLSFPPPSHASNAFNTSQTLRDDGSTLISSDGTFELGFYGTDNSKNRYVGIRYRKITTRTIVWVANRDNPLADSSGVLTLVEPGILTLVNGTNSIIWSANASRGARSPVVKLLDSGNLIVKDANDDDSPQNFLWQSFDYPTDTLLPGMKLGWNFITGHEVYITSRRTSDDPASGDYTYHCDPDGYPQNIIKRGTNVRFKSGPWNGVRFSGSPNLNPNIIYTYEVVITKDEAYFESGLRNVSQYSMMTLSENGLGQRLVWNDQTQTWDTYRVFPVDDCDFYNVCGAHGSCNTGSSPVCDCLEKFKPMDPGGWERGNWSNGCVRRTPLDCEKGDVFLKYSGIKLPDSQFSRYDDRMSLDECRVTCSRNCSCTAYSSLDISDGESGCLMWFGELVDMRRVSQGQDIYIRMASSELEHASNSTDTEGRKKPVVLILTLSLVVGTLVVLALGLLLYFRKRKRQERGEQRLDDVEDHNDLELPLFDFSTITKATENFSAKNKLGRGGFGSVYKGRLEDGQEIAVKRLSRTSRQGMDEFKNEVVCIAKLQHRNLVKLLGWCIHGKEMMLVYEYLPNKSLNLILFDQVKSAVLDWQMRFNIINSIARALMYLHQDSRLRIIHRDLKASNILLDSEMNPKISDFGLARIFGGKETGAKTSRVVGTFGYMSPEYAARGLFSVKSDVFSFGVLVLEIVTGKRNARYPRTDHHLDLLGHAWMLHREEKSLTLVDSSIRDSCNISEVLRSIHIGLLCVQECPEDRPSMSLVVQMLGNDSVLPEAKYPGFFIARDLLTIKTPLPPDVTYSINTITCSSLEAR